MRKTFARGILLGACLLLAGPVRGAVTYVGSCTNWYEDTGATNRMVFELEQGVCEIVPYAADTVRVRWHWDGLWGKDDVALVKGPSDFPAFAWSNRFEGGKVYLDLPELMVEVTLSTNFGVNFYDVTAPVDGGYKLAETWRWEYNPAYDPVVDGTYHNLRYSHTLPYEYKVKALMEMPAGEAYFGLGQVPESLNHRGHDLQLWNSDTYGWYSDWNPMYHSFPFFYTVKPAVPGSNPASTHGIFFNNSARTVFRYGTEATIPDKYSFEAGDGQIDFFFFGGGADHRMQEVLKRYTELTGTPAKLPKWAYGYQTCRWSYDNQTWVEWLAETFADSATSNFPLDVIYLDIDYMNASVGSAYQDNNLRQLQFNTNFPTPVSMISHCNERGIKVIPIIEPWINRWHPGLWDEAANAQHFLKDNSGNQLVTDTFFGSVSWLDFTSTDARTWWKGKLKNFMTAYPISGIWNDLNEPASMVDSGEDLIPRNGLFWMDGRFGDNSDSRRWSVNNHNTYCIYETRASYEAMEEHYPNRRPMVMSRAGFPGVQKYAVSWTGDNRALWDHGLRTAIRNCNNIMISGQANVGDDIGGFVTNTTAELITRWHQKAVLDPIARNHSQKGTPDREPFRYSATYYNAMKKAVDFRYKLMPYFYTLAHRSHETGVPVHVPVVFYHEGDTTTHSTSEYDMLAGEHLLAAPVYTDGARTRTVYLPGSKTWYYWPMGEFDTNTFTGGSSVTVDAALDVLPLFVEEGAIIPMGPRMQYMNEFQPDFLNVLVWPATNETTFTLFEDDGETFNYTTGVYAETTFTVQRQASNEMTCVVGARSGSYDPYTNGTRRLNLLVHDFDAPGQVTLDSSPLTEYPASNDFDSCTTGWRHDAATRILYVRTADGFGGTIAAGSTNVPPGTASWQPDPPARDGSLTVTYEAAPGTILHGSTQMNLHIGSAASATGAVTGVTIVPMTPGTNDDWSASWAVPHFAYRIRFHLEDGEGGADRNDGAYWSDVVDGPMPADFAVTDPATDPLTVTNGVSEYSVAGWCNPAVFSGEITWVNAALAQTGTVAVAESWTATPAVPLVVGTNQITVTATNFAAGTPAADSATNDAYSSLVWSNGMNAGTGFGAWALTEPSGTSLFIADSATHSYVSFGPQSWGMHARTGATAWAERSLAEPLEPGGVIRVGFDNGSVDSGRRVSFDLLNAGGDPLFRFYFYGGMDYYRVSDNEGIRDTPLPFTSAGVSLEFTLQDTTNYVLDINGTNFTGALSGQTNLDISALRFENFSAGENADHDFLFNNLEVDPGQVAISTSVSFVVVRSDVPSEPDADEDGLPDDYELLYTSSTTGMVASGHSDADPYTNLEEYWLGTDPTNSESQLDFEVIRDGVSGGVEVSWQSVGGRSYRLESAEDLQVGGFTNIVATVICEETAGVEAVTTITNSEPDPGRWYYYRVIGIRD